MNKVDVAINVYGKPYHTLVSILSLLKYSSEHIDKIYLVEEYKHPHGDSIEDIFSFLPQEKIIHLKPKYYFHYDAFDYTKIGIEEYRHSIRYQYAFEKTDKDYLFIMHNDVLFSGDTIGNMLEKIKGTEYVGIGIIGMCWNCPASYAGMCSGDNYDKYNPTYEEAVEIVKKYPSPRTTEELINKERPMPFPECRLNEFFALINTKILQPLVMPQGDIKPIGEFSFEIGTEFFRELFMKGYRFVNYKETDVQHGWITTAGHPINYDKQEYERVEAIAKEYFQKNLLN